MSIVDLLRGLFRGVARLLAFIRATVANLIVLGIIAVVVLALMALPDTDVPEGAALLLAPKGLVVEQEGGSDPFTLLGAGSTAETRLDDILRAIEKAGEDGRIRALVLDPSSLAAVSPADLDVIGNALQAFRETGKRIVAKSRYYGRDQYYLASFADDIYLHPLGDVMLSGYGMYNNYFRGLLDKFKVKMHVFRVGTYKAFVEPYTLSGMSDAAKDANQQTVDALWERFVTRVAENRGIPPDALYAYANQYDEHVLATAGDAARAALDHGLVDALLTDAQVQERLRVLAGRDDKNAYRRVPFAAYLQPRIDPLLGDAVAVVTASGPIVTGKRPRGFVGAKNMAKLLGDARKDDAIKAVVLRVDSGGGSVLASELIRQEVVRVQEAGKPVVVSMGGTAASGGYWIGATADEIWAAPTTITGSIGIFAIVPTFEDTLAEVGVTWDGVGTGPFVGALDPTGGLGGPMARALQASIDHGYRQFLDLVAEGRDMTPEQVDAIGQGRVWTGAQALERGLVDKIGHLQDAIEGAAALAELTSFGVRYLEQPLSPQEILLRTLFDDFAPDLPGVRLTGAFASRFAHEVRVLDALADPKHIYALCELCRGIR